MAASKIEHLRYQRQLYLGYNMFLICYVNLMTQYREKKYPHDYDYVPIFWQFLLIFNFIKRCLNTL